MKILLAATIGLAAAAALAACSHPAPAVAPGATSAARGAQLVALGGCNDCHTPRLPNGQPDVSRELSGFPAGGTLPPTVAGADLVETNGAFRGPWGLSLARNITSDKSDGIGSWTQAEFIKTLRTGIDPAGHAIQPPMPWQDYVHVPDADLIAIYNYLLTVPASTNKVDGS
ncbi:MAG: hypothetical protein ACRD0Y_05805 [Terriglobales bacterium]